jgi:hypothetical protein
MRENHRKIVGLACIWLKFCESQWKVIKFEYIFDENWKFFAEVIEIFCWKWMKIAGVSWVSTNFLLQATISWMKMQTERWAKRIYSLRSCTLLKSCWKYSWINVRTLVQCSSIEFYKLMCFNSFSVLCLQILILLNTSSTVVDEQSLLINSWLMFFNFPIVSFSTKLFENPIDFSSERLTFCVY